MARTIVIGDIHGCFDELMELMEKMALRDDDYVVSLGDIADRGPKSKEVYAFFRNRPNSKALVGNHERKHQKQVLNYAQEIVKVQFGDVYHDFLNWIAALSYFHETDDAIVVHAAFEHDRLLTDQKEEVLSGSTSGEKYLEKKYGPENHWSDFYQGTKPIIYGHHVVGDTPLIKNNTFGIDTGACHGGYLTAIALPGFEVFQVKVKQDYWRQEQLKWQIPVLNAKDWGNMEIASIENQLEKLSYIEDADVKNYLSEKKGWLQEIENMVAQIEEKLKIKCAELQRQFGEDFNKAASQYTYKTLLFKCNANTLTPTDIKKSVNTPNKIIQLVQELSQ